MITTKEFPDRQFSTKEEMLKVSAENKNAVLATKKMQVKYADSVCYHTTVTDTANKEVSKNVAMEVGKIKSKVVINTTNLMDSHNDVHIKGIWNRSLSHKNNPYLLQEHQMKFQNIISDEVNANVQEMTFKSLGYDLPGKTEALIFDATIAKERHPYMFEQYAKGYVKNHSVGMMYGKIEMAINSDEDWAKDEKAVWDKYFPMIANKEQAEETGYFFPVTEAKILEGSAVPMGSNWATPTISVEPVNDTSTKGSEQSRQEADTVKKPFLIKLKQ